jgi:ABC-type lipoprotein export system ATPase subunit
VLVTHEAHIVPYARRVLTFQDGMVVGDEPVTDPRNAREILTSRPAEGATP